MEEEPKTYRAIMVSSTFTDLEAHRREVIEAIHRFGFHANVMEYSGARSDADVIDASLRMVRESVAYLCVIGHKYGQTPVESNRNPKGMSITELEFNEAQRLGRPILLFLMADDHPVLPVDVESDTKKRKKLDAFRRHAKRIDAGVALERVYDSFASKEDFAKKAAIAIGLLAIQAAGGSDLPGPAVRDAIARFVDVKPGANQTELADAIEHFEAGYRALEQQLAAIKVTDNRVTSLKVAAEAALAEGDLDKARAAYREAADAARDKVAEPARIAAELKAAEADAHLLALDWEAADAAWTEAAAMLAPFDVEAAEDIEECAAIALFGHGNTFAQSSAIVAALNRWERLAACCDSGPITERSTRLTTRRNGALATLGKHTAGDDGIVILERAVAAYRHALTTYAKDPRSLEWGKTHYNISNVLNVLAERASAETKPYIASEATLACRAALTAFDPATDPTRWGMTQCMLGRVLKMQDDVSDGSAGLALLTEAEGACRAALTVFSKAGAPAYWAMAQNMLMGVLQALGVRTGGAKGLALLATAVRGCDVIMEVNTKSKAPVDWALANMNSAECSVAIADLGHEPSEQLRLAEARLVNALSVFTSGSFYHGEAAKELEAVRKKIKAL